MATRYSGKVTVRIGWSDAQDQYTYATSVDGKHWSSGAVGAPKHLTQSVDSPKALDEAAAAAISFANLTDEAAYTDRGLWIGRSKAQAWPREAGVARAVRGAEVDEHAAHELDVYAENTSELYAQKKSILANIARRHKSGTYDHAKAPKLWMYLVDAAARRYRKEFGGGPETFNKVTREAVARELADRYRSGQE